MRRPAGFETRSPEVIVREATASDCADGIGLKRGFGSFGMIALVFRVKSNHASDWRMASWLTNTVAPS